MNIVELFGIFVIVSPNFSSDFTICTCINVWFEIEWNKYKINVSTRLKCNRRCLVNMTAKDNKRAIFMNRQMCWLICCSLVCFALYVFDDAWNLKLVMYWYIYIFLSRKNCQTLLKMDRVQEGFFSSFHIDINGPKFDISAK